MNLAYNEDRLGMICDNDQMHVMDCYGDAVPVPFSIEPYYFQQADA